VRAQGPPLPEESLTVPEITIKIRNRVGLHARPASLFVQTAAGFKSDITVHHRGASANAKSILHVLSLGVSEGSEITIRAEGEDADQALKALEDLNAKDFGQQA